MSFMDRIKGAVDEAVEKSKTAVGENADKINSAIDTVTSTADARTGGKYADRISKLKETAQDGVSSLKDPTAAGAAASAADAVDKATPEPAIPDAEVVED
jgi:type IV secretory pathway TrbL component